MDGIPQGQGKRQPPEPDPSCERRVLIARGVRPNLITTEYHSAAAVSYPGRKGAELHPMRADHSKKDD